MANLILKQGFSSLESIVKAEYKNLSELLGTSILTIQKIKANIKLKIELLRNRTDSGDSISSEEVEEEFGIHAEDDDFGQEV